MMPHDSPADDPSQPTAEDARSVRNSRRRKFKLAVIGFSGCLFVALDLLAGSFWRFEPQDQQQQSFRTAHPYYHHGLRPRQHRRTSWGPYDYDMATNSLGCRDRDVRDVPLRTRERRIVLIGDSMIEGLGVEFDETVVGRLQARWSDKNVEVLNAGVVSFSPRLYELRTRFLLEEEGLRFDELVVFIDISDIQDELFYESFQPQRAVVATGPRRGWWWRHSLVSGLIERVFSGQRRIDNRFFADAEINVWMESTEAFVNAEGDPEQGRFEWTVNDTLYEQWGEKGLLLAGRHMALLRDLCREHQIELSVVVYPSPVQIYASDRDSRQVRYWREFCTESDVRFIDLFPTFIDSTYSGPADVYQRYFIAEDVHWNPAGHLLVADRIAEELDAEWPGPD